MRPTPFEYRTEQIDLDDSHDIAHLNDLGAAGWKWIDHVAYEHASSPSEVIGLFIRKKEEPLNEAHTM